MKKSILGLFFALFLTSCATPPVPTADLSIFSSPSSVQRRAVCIGLTKLDKTSEWYVGWEGALPGVDLDVRRFASACQDKGHQVVVLTNEQATVAGVRAAIMSAAAGLGRNGLLTIYFSGHGAQVPDFNGDEADGMDETIYLWDRPILDDDLWEWFSMLADLRIFYVTDTCNSGTNYKLPRPVRMSPSVRVAPTAPTVRLIHWGAVSDGAYARGDSTGGVFTKMFWDFWNPMFNGRKTYWQYYKSMRMMLRQQAPDHATEGDVERFLRTPILE